jgi:hypothetical protein
MTSRSIISWCQCNFCTERNQRIRSGVRRPRPATEGVVKEIRREGQRILQAGTNIYVQPDRKKGTKRYEGWVIECYANNTVKLQVPRLGDSIVVEVDEFVKARRGTTKGTK